MNQRALAVITAAFLATGCATIRDYGDAPPVPPSEVALCLPSGAVALVLSGGSARGFAHVGVIKVLEQAGIKLDLIVGTSVGSMVGALYASGMTASELEAAAAEPDASMLRDFTFSTLGLLRGTRLEAFIAKKVGDRPTEAFPIRFAAVATDFQTGRIVAFTRGDAGIAVRASSSVPGLFTPVRIRERMYVDGGLASPLPIAVARSFGADVIIAVDVLYPPEDSELGGLPSTVFQTLLIQMQRIKAFEIVDADVVIAPDMHTAGGFSFTDRLSLVQAGEAAALAAMPAIRAAISRGGSTARVASCRGR